MDRRRRHGVRNRFPRTDAEQLSRVLDWYFDNRYGRTEGPGTTPFYCDPQRVGTFAVSARDLASGRDAATFRLFITLSMYQALRDVVIMRQQKRLSRKDVNAIASLSVIKTSTRRGQCPVLRQPATFATHCDVRKTDGHVDCGRTPGVTCNVKDATRVFNRMGDMGKLPTSAYHSAWSEGGLRTLLATVAQNEPSPAKRAVLLVDNLRTIHRVGRKLASLFVSALSTPALAPGLSPWFPQVDGNILVVVDTNVARAVDALSQHRGSRSYAFREEWIREKSKHLDLSRYGPALPRYSPRIVQQALYAFCSRSNRLAMSDRCQELSVACNACAPHVCPFAWRERFRSQE